jgi:L-asparaginase / beta-aspartyl-peptidase
MKLHRRMRTFLKKCVVLCLCANYSIAMSQQEKPEYVLLIHGGAGNFNSLTFSSEQRQTYSNTLEKVLQLGDSLLKIGVSAVDVAVACVAMLEDAPVFNAGRGAVLNEHGQYELDASVMCGERLSAGAIAGVSRIKNPIQTAKVLMLEGKHVMLSGIGAEVYARTQNQQLVEPSYFFNQKTHDRYRSIKESGGGTVGAVVMDTNGNLAAATSTGGMMMKRYGRIGDSPIIGAGTYADNNWCAVSCTGHGEFFIRFVAAYDVCALMKYAQLPLEDAVFEVLRKIHAAGGSGGIIAIDKTGNHSALFTTQSMFRAYVDSNGQRYVEF